MRKQILVASLLAAILGAAGSSYACWSDYDCQYGEKCMKAQFQPTGYCAKVVNQYGLPAPYYLPKPDSILPGGRGQCSFDTDCPIMFYCAKEAGALTGACLKRD